MLHAETDATYAHTMGQRRADPGVLCAGRAAQSMSAMVTSTSTPGSIWMDVICFTISDGECRSMRRLWMRISNLSYVLVPSPLGALRVTILRRFVGRRTGPF